MSLLKEADAGHPVNEIWRSNSISSATYYKWKSTYGGLAVADLTGQKELEHENSRLKLMCGDLSLANAAVKEPPRKKALRPAKPGWSSRTWS